MNYKTKAALLLAISMGVATIHYAQNNNVMVKNQFSAEQQEVLNAIFSMTNAFHHGDISGVMNSYEKEATVVFEPGTPEFHSNKIKEQFQGLFGLNPQFEYFGHEVFINGDIALHFSPWKMKGTAPDGTAIEQSGLSVAVLRKQENGKWLMVIDNPHGGFLLDNMSE